MATFRTCAEVLTPDHPLMKPGRAGGAYETTTPLSERFRDRVRAVAELTSDDELRRIAELPEVRVSLENCRQLDPQTRIVMICRLDVSPAETPRGQRIPPAGIPAAPRSEIDALLRACRGARIEEHALPDGSHARHAWPAKLDQRFMMTAAGAGSAREWGSGAAASALRRLGVRG
jgi:hypothetical protein